MLGAYFDYSLGEREGVRPEGEEKKKKRTQMRSFLNSDGDP